MWQVRLLGLVVATIVFVVYALWLDGREAEMCDDFEMRQHFHARGFAEIKVYYWCLRAKIKWIIKKEI